MMSRFKWGSLPLGGVIAAFTAALLGEVLQIKRAAATTHHGRTAGVFRPRRTLPACAFPRVRVVGSFLRLGFLSSL